MKGFIFWIMIAIASAMPMKLNFGSILKPSGAAKNTVRDVQFAPHDDVIAIPKENNGLKVSEYRQAAAQYKKLKQAQLEAHEDNLRQKYEIKRSNAFDEDD